MRAFILKYVIVFTLVILSGAMLMDVSHRVQRAERQIARTDRAIAQEQENIRVLKAEWAYLNNPERLERLAVEGLDLSAPQTSTLISNPDILPDTLPRIPSPKAQSQPTPSPLYIETSTSTSSSADGGAR